jgi:prepilin peptidase CpaA
MALSSAADGLACSLFAAAMIHVIVTDLRSRRIRNWLVAGMAAAYLPLAAASGLSAAHMAAALAAAVLVFALGFGAFAAGWIGGGDVKLAAVTTLWLGAGQALPFLLLTSLIGAALALALLAIGAFARAGTAFAGQAQTDRRTLPYGPALALAGIILLRDSPWVDAL